MSKKLSLKKKNSEWEILPDDIPMAQDGKLMSNEEKKKVLKEKGILPEQEFKRNKYQESLSNNLRPIGYDLNNFIKALYKKTEGREILKRQDVSGNPKFVSIQNPDIFKNGGKIKTDPNGYWDKSNHGKPVKIPSNQITMRGVNQPLYGVDDTGFAQMMYPNQDYQFPGNSVTEYPLTQKAQNGKLLTLEDFRPKNPNSNERIQQQIINNSNFNRATKGTTNNPVKLPEIEVVAQKNRNPATAQAAGQRWREANKDKEINSGQLASAMFVAPITEALHTPSRFVNQGIRIGQGKGLGDYDSEISQTLGLETNPDDAWHSVRNFVIDNAADFVAPNVLKGVGKNIGKSINYIDDISNINKELKLIRDKGLSSGLSEKEIKTLQMEKIGITDSQRKAFTPIVSDVLAKYVKPISYEEGVFSKLKSIPSNIKSGGWKNTMEDYSHVGKREDAWNLYLGKPQVNNTFRYSQTTPQSMIYPELKNKMDIYHLNYENDLAEYVNYMDKSKKYNKLLQGETIYPSDAGVMGGYNLTRIDGNIGKSGLGKVEYNDIWDLHPKTTLRSIFPEKLAKNEWLNDNIFYKTSPEGISSPRQIELKMEKFIGKPFMSHGKVPVNFTEPNNSFLNTISDKDKKLYDFLKFAKGYKYQSGGKIKNSDWELID